MTKWWNKKPKFSPNVAQIVATVVFTLKVMYSLNGQKFLQKLSEREVTAPKFESNSTLLFTQCDQTLN